MQRAAQLLRSRLRVLHEMYSWSVILVALKSTRYSEGGW